MTFVDAFVLDHYRKKRTTLGVGHVITFNHARNEINTIVVLKSNNAVAVSPFGSAA